MAKLVAIEWDSAEVRVVVGRTRGTEVVVEQAATADLPRKDEDIDVGPHLGALLNRLQVGRSEVLIGIGRANIELRKLQLPPAPDDELPDMVRFQAMRQFTTIGEDWPLDYVPLQNTEAGVEVLAAALSPTIVQQISTTCANLELTPKCLVLRPFAAASLLMRANPNETRCCLVVDVLSTEADLFVLTDGNVAFLRTVRLPDAEHGSPALITALVGEVRRTIAAAQSQMAGRRIEVITVLADQGRHAELREVIGNQLTLPIEMINPFSAVKLTGELERQLPEWPGRFAPLLGMMLDEAAETGHRIDFLHPRKRPEPKSNRTRYLAITTAVVAVFCAFALLLKWQLDKKDKQVADLRAQLESIKTNVDTAVKTDADLMSVEQFLSVNTPWLTELVNLAEKLPPAKDVMITSIDGAAVRDEHTRVVVNGRARTSELVGNMEASLRRNTRFRVEPGELSPKSELPPYQWEFRETLYIEATEPAPPTNVAQQNPDTSTPSPPSASDSPAGDSDADAAADAAAAQPEAQS